MPDDVTAQILPPGARADRRRLWIGALVILALAFLVYRPILPGNFLMDDRRLLETDNPLVNGELKPVSIWFQTDFPLSTLALWLEWRAWGAHSGPGHAVNIILHACSGILLWRLLNRLKIPGGWLAGALFAVHPVCVNSVARIAEIKNTLSLPLFLLSIWCYFSTGRFRYPLSFALFVLALTSKTSTIMMPVVLLGLVAWQNGRVVKRDILRVLPFFVLALMFGLMSVWFQKHQAITGSLVVQESPGQRIAMAGRIFWFYLGKALWPVNLNLVYPQWPSEELSLPAFIPTFMIIAVAIVCWRFRRSWGRHVLLGLGLYAVMLFPALGFFASQFLTKWRVSDHLQYLPLIAPVSLLAGGLAGMLPRIIARGISVVIIVAFSCLAFQRAGVFASEEKLFNDTLAKNPSAWGTENDLGVIMAARGNYTEALTHLEKSLRIKSDNPDAQSNLGQVLAAQGRYEDAEPFFVGALKLNPDDPETRRRYAHDLMGQHRLDDAITQLRLALALSPKADIRTRFDLVNLLHQTGHLREAAGELRQIVAMRPDSVEGLNNLAWLLATAPDDSVRDGPAAVQLAERAVQLPPVTNLCVLGTLAAAYAEVGQFTNAVATAEKAVQQETAAGNARFANMNRLLLKYYMEGRPFREPQANR